MNEANASTTGDSSVCHEQDMPLDPLVTDGQISDYTPVLELLGQHKAEAVIADKGCDSDEIVANLERTTRAWAVIPPAFKPHTAAGL